MCKKTSDLAEDGFPYAGLPPTYHTIAPDFWMKLHPLASRVAQGDSIHDKMPDFAVAPAV